MSNFLYVMVGPVPLLLAGDAVCEILPMSSSVCASGHQQWRDALLPVVHGGDLLELTPQAMSEEVTGVVYRCHEQESPILLLVSSVMRLLSLQPSDFAPLPAVPEKVHRLFDGIYVDRCEARQVYRFRTPLAQETLTQIG